ncbi:MAG: CotS family spore coat protein [Bacillota bacterium]|nr:CotS family spore coat protein [Clostridia bacterium]
MDKRVYITYYRVQKTEEEKVVTALKGVLPVLNQYDLSVKGIIPIQEDVYRIETPRGVYCLKCANKGEHKMLFIYSVLKHLVDNGFHKVSAPVPTQDGSPLAKLDREIYFMTEWVFGNPCNFKRNDHLTQATITLAEFHKYAKEAVLLPGAKARVMYKKWPHVFRTRTDELKAFKKTVQDKRTPNVFEKRFLSHANHFIELAEKACQTLNNSAYEKIAQRAEKEKTFTHRDVAARNFIIGEKKEAFLIDFDYSRFDIRAADVVRLTERSLRDEKWNKDKGELVFKTYNKVYPLEPEQYQVMLAFFQFPQKVWRLANRYFIGKYPWQEEGYLKKLMSAIRKLSYQEKFAQFFEEKYCK